MNEPLAWLVRGPFGGVAVRLNRKDAEFAAARGHGLKVTPLVAASPEGAPTWEELVRGLRDACAMINAARPDAWDSDIVEQGINEGDYQASMMRDWLNALLSRIPTEEA